MNKTGILIFTLLVLSSCRNTGAENRDMISIVSEGIILSEQSGLMWQQDDSKLISNASDAQKYVNKLTLGGFSDWRIPTKAESHNLYFSLDFGESMANDLNVKMEHALWVRLDDGKMVPGSWDAGETCCIVRTFKKDIRARVRAVRP
jgi:hypothetical protein